MRLSGTALTVTLAILAVPVSPDVQQPGRVARIGILTGGSPSSPIGTLTWGAFRQGLREYGYVEGQNIAIEFRQPQDRESARPHDSLLHPPPGDPRDPMSDDLDEVVVAEVFSWA